ncbi:MAG: hypothetical protein HC877_23965 [Thioploca sp.]|nr:hypothetical protein [Thioploca sp.]
MNDIKEKHLLTSSTQSLLRLSKFIGINPHNKTSEESEVQYKKNLIKSIRKKIAQEELNIFNRIKNRSHGSAS